MDLVRTWIRCAANPKMDAKIFGPRTAKLLAHVHGTSPEPPFTPRATPLRRPNNPGFWIP